jgi:orotidine-5'-phosphate decarboxylase
MIIDKLYDNVLKKGNVCVGLDTAVEYLPKEFLNKYEYLEDALYRFNQKIIASTLDIAACYKVQIAYYEALGLKGMMVYKKTLEYIRSKGAVVIADIKRGDIADTAKMYAKAHFQGEFESDFVTLNPYMGLDSVEPYLPYVKNNEKGIFLLVRTSNPGAEDIQYLNCGDGKKVYNEIGDKIQKIGENYMGKYGYSSIGGVVGCTHQEEGEEIRDSLNKTFLLIPGYGAQGGKAQDVSVYLNDGNGGVVNSSRGILLAYKNHEDGGKRFDEYAREEAIKMRREIKNSVLKNREEKIEKGA